ncbi:MAG: hypothetical protein ACK5LJ_16010, partial [Paracoccus sp. (in: a-proteobacteria)]
SPERQEEISAQVEEQIKTIPRPSASPAMRDVIQAASDESARKTATLILKSVAATKDAPNPAEWESYLERVMRVFLDQDKDGNPIVHNKPRTPKIPGTNTPKRSSKRKS